MCSAVNAVIKIGRLALSKNIDAAEPYSCVRTYVVAVAVAALLHGTRFDFFFFCFALFWLPQAPPLSELDDDRCNICREAPKGAVDEVVRIVCDRSEGQAKGVVAYRRGREGGRGEGLMY